MAGNILSQTQSPSPVPAPAAAVDLRSERLRSLPPFLFNVIDDKKRAAIAAGKDVINLGTGDPDRPTPAFIVEELQRAATVPYNHQYPDCYGTKRFLAAAAAYMQRRFGVTVDPARHLLATIGGKDGISHLPLGVLNPGDGAIVFTPAYPVYNQASILAGAKVTRIQMNAAHQWRPDPATLTDAVLRANKLLWLNFPGNPTGATVSVAQIDELAVRALRHGVIVASDLAYSEIYFEHGADASPSLFQCPGVDIETSPAIEFHSLSKTFNMTGWRLGFAVGNERVIKALKQTKDNYDSGPFNAVQDAGALALERYDDPAVADMRRQYAMRRDIAITGLRAVGCQAEPPEAGIFVWARCPVEAGTGRPMNSWKFVEKLIDETAVVVVPGAGFADTAAEWFRLSLTRETERIAEAMQRLGRLKF